MVSSRMTMLQATGVAGAGGILVDPGGQVEQRFAWGLGSRTNNEAEWMALLQGLQLIRDKKTPEGPDIWRFQACYL